MYSQSTNPETATGDGLAAAFRAGATLRDVSALTIYVVNYRPADLGTIRNAGAAYAKLFRSPSSKKNT